MARHGTGSRRKRHTQDLFDSWIAARPDLEMADFLQGIALMRIGRIIDLSFDRMCRKAHGISGSDMRVLFALRRSGEPFQLRPTDLFRAMLVTSGTMTRHIDRLSGKGYVERKPDPRHSGGYLISLTVRGREAADRATELLATDALLRTAAKGMTAEQRKNGADYVFALLCELEAATSFAANLPSR